MSQSAEKTLLEIRDRLANFFNPVGRLKVSLESSSIPGSEAIPITSPDNSVDITPVLTASAAYAPGDALGGLVTLTDVAYANGKSIFFQNCILKDLAEQTFTATMLVFNANPSGSTFTDKDPINVVDADASKLIAMVSFSTFKDVGGFKVAMQDDKSIKATPLAGSRDLYVAFMIDSGTPSIATGQILCHAELFRNY